MILAFDVRQQLLDIVQTPACSQTELAGFGTVRAAFRRSFNGLQAGAKRFVDHLPERRAQFLGNRSRPVQNIVVDHLFNWRILIVAGQSDIELSREVP